MTLRELLARAEFALKYSMDGPSLIAAAICNQYRRVPTDPHQINPYRRTERRSGIRITTTNLRAIARVLVDGE